MISFIIIGRNEGWKLTQCIESVLKAIKKNTITDYEIIYVDSISTDDSIKRAKEFDEVKILMLNSNFNAAIARNAGVLESKGSLLYFLDGDMELNPDFIKEVKYLQNKNIKFISGQLENHYYDENWNLLKIKNLFGANKLNIYDTTNGGAFVIERSLWQSVNGMRTKYKRSQDVDLNYRLSRKGFRIFRSTETIVKHHNIQYHYNASLKNDILNFRKYLFRGMLIRDHLFNLSIWKRNIRINYSLFLFLTSLVLSIAFLSFLYFVPYILIILYRSYSQFRRFKNVINVNYINIFIKYIYQDITGIVGILFFFPINKKISYDTIK